jgi:uncharacterized protein YegP (UPF0339 family)
MTVQIEVWANRYGQWYWHFRSKGRVTADSESFPSKAHALRAAKAVVRAVIKRLATSVFRPDPPRFESALVGEVLIVKWH